MRGMPSMSRTVQQWFGLSGMIVLAVRSLILTATVTGPLWWCATRGAGQSTYFIAGRVWLGGGGSVWGRLQAPSVHLRRTAEFTPTGAGIHAAGHPWYQGCLWPGVTKSVGNFCTGPLLGPGIENTREKVHTPTCEIVGTGSPWSNKYGPWELDSVLCHHRTPHCSTQGPGVFPGGGPLHLPPQGRDCDAEAERPDEK